MSYPKFKKTPLTTSVEELVESATSQKWFTDYRQYVENNFYSIDNQLGISVVDSSIDRFCSKSPNERLYSFKDNKLRSDVANKGTIACVLELAFCRFLGGKVKQHIHNVIMDINCTSKPQQNKSHIKYTCNFVKRLEEDLSHQPSQSRNKMIFFYIYAFVSKAIDSIKKFITLGSRHVSTTTAKQLKGFNTVNLIDVKITMSIKICEHFCCDFCSDNIFN